MKAGWKWQTLAEIAKVYNGNSIPAKEKEENYIGLDSGTPYIGTKDVSFNNKIDYDNGVLIPETKSSEFKVVPPMSVLVCAEGGSAGRKVAHNDRMAHFGNKLFAIVPNANTISKYLFYYFISKSFLEAFSALKTGLIGGVSLKKFKTIMTPLPPFPEQKRIVSILDEAFAGIATAVANAEKNLANARELFESHLNIVFTQNGEGAKTYALDELCKSGRGITYGVIKLGPEVPDGVPCLRTSNVRWLSIDTDNMKRIAHALSENYSRTILQGGEVLVNVRGTLGGVAVASSDMTGWNVSREVAVVPTEAKRLQPDYLSYWIGTKSSQDWLTGVQKGVAYTGINLMDLRMLPVALPDIMTQTKIVEHIKNLQCHSSHLESIYQRKLNSLAELKQSILQKAFAGELTANHYKALKETAL